MRKFIAGALVAGASIPLLAGVATAASGGAHDGAHKNARCTAAVDTELATLAKLDAAVTAAKHLTDAHRSAITATNAAARSGLTDLEAKIAADTDKATLETDCRSARQDYRIRGFRLPQERIVIAADTEAAAIAELRALGDKVPADLQAKVADAATQITGLADGVLAETPADFNADHAVLKPARAAVRTAAADLKAVRAGLKGAKKHHGTTTTTAPRS